MRPASRRSIHLARPSSRMLPFRWAVDRSVRHQRENDDRVVITGIGLVTAIGNSRESIWRAIQRGDCGVRRLTNVPGIPDGLMLGATVDIEGEFPGQLKNIPLCRQTAAEALADSRLHLAEVDRERFGCSIGAHMGDTDFVVEQLGLADQLIPQGKRPWWTQWFPSTACATVARDYDLRGPRLSNST